MRSKMDVLAWTTVLVVLFAAPLASAKGRSGRSSSRGYSHSRSSTRTRGSSTGSHASSSGRSSTVASASGRTVASHPYISHGSGTRCASCARSSSGRIARSSVARRQFTSQHPCPSGGRSGTCKGYVIDHIVPLKRGGSDSPGNMQWQTTTEAKAKDKVE